MITAGGEVAFVKRMIEESVALGDRCRSVPLLCAPVVRTRRVADFTLLDSPVTMKVVHIPPRQSFVRFFRRPLSAREEGAPSPSRPRPIRLLFVMLMKCSIFLFEW